MEGVETGGEATATAKWLGLPQWIQATAASECRCSQSGQTIKGIRFSSVWC